MFPELTNLGFIGKLLRFVPWELTGSAQKKESLIRISQQDCCRLIFISFKADGLYELLFNYYLLVQISIFKLIPHIKSLLGWEHSASRQRWSAPHEVRVAVAVVILWAYSNVENTHPYFLWSRKHAERVGWQSKVKTQPVFRVLIILPRKTGKPIAQMLPPADMPAISKAKSLV